MYYHPIRMDPAEVRSLLNEGIRAVKANDHARARDQLLRVLAADDRNEPAWLWLSAALDEPADKLKALEEVLAINPRHPQALAGAKALRERLGQIGATAEPDTVARPLVQPTADGTVPVLGGEAGHIHPAPETVPPAAGPAAPQAHVAGYDMLASEDDPFQCAYCGRQTHPDDERCRHCGRSLLAPGPWRGGGYLYIGLLMTGLQLQSALVQALAAYLVSVYPQATRILPIAWVWTSNLLVPAIVRAIAWTVVVLLLLADYEGGYGIAALVALVDLIWAGIGYRLGWLGPAQAGANAALGIIIFLIGLMAVISQAQSRVRVRVVPDRNLAGPPMIHRRALAYARQGKWALAALHWRRAIGRAPAEPLYYKALGRANVRLGRYAEAVRAFKSGAEAAPSDQEFVRLIEKVRVHARSS